MLGKMMIQGLVAAALIAAAAAVYAQAAGPATPADNGYLPATTVDAVTSRNGMSKVARATLRRSTPTIERSGSWLRSVPPKPSMPCSRHGMLRWPGLSSWPT
jgi:hypothetical protein